MNTCCIKEVEATPEEKSGQKIIASDRYRDITCSEFKCYREEHDRRRLSSSAPELDGNPLEKFHGMLWEQLPHGLRLKIFSKHRFGGIKNISRNLMHEATEEERKKAIEQTAAWYESGCTLYSMSYGVVGLQIFTSLFVIIGSFFLCCACCACCWKCCSCKSYQSQHKCCGRSMAVMSVLQLAVFAWCMSCYTTVSDFCKIMGIWSHHPTTECKRHIESYIILIMVVPPLATTALAFVFTGCASLCACRAGYKEHSEDGTVQGKEIQMHSVMATDKDKAVI